MKRSELISEIERLKSRLEYLDSIWDSIKIGDILYYERCNGWDIDYIEVEVVEK